MVEMESHGFCMLCHANCDINRREKSTNHFWSRKEGDDTHREVGKQVDRYRAVHEGLT